MYSQLGQVTDRYRRRRDANGFSPALKGGLGHQRAKRGTIAGAFDFAAREHPSVSAFDRRDGVEIRGGARTLASAGLFQSDRLKVLFAKAK
jgi:hypothetical protein